MIPDSFRKQQRAIYLSTQKRTFGQTLSTKEEAELKALEKEAHKKIKKILANTEKIIKASKAHQRRTRNLSVGTYGSYTQAA
jgi:hypothetical protein